MYNLHTHTNYSHDGKCTLFELVEGAVNVLDGIAVTEHYDFIKIGCEKIVETAVKCYKDVLKAREIYQGKIKIFMGGEFGEEDENINLGNELRSAIPFDMISCSHHIIPELKSAKDFGYYYDFKNATKKELDYFMNLYIDGLLKSITSTDVDVLCHLTLPARYIMRSGNNYDVTKLDNKFETLLRTHIKNGGALEVNTSEFDTLNLFMPDKHFLEMFKSLGGELITIGSDAHTPSRLNVGLFEAVKLIKEVGFDSYCYFENRKPYKIKI